MTLKSGELVFRSWNYFRHGYSTYLTFFVSFFTFVSTTYYLAISGLPFLRGIFPHFYVFIVVGVAVTIPVGALLGWLHMKGTLAHPTDIAINTESNPYTYTITPGKETEIHAPTWILLLRMLQKTLEKEGVLSDEEKREFENIRAKWEKLLKGGVVGRPRQRQVLAKLKRQSTQ